MVSAVLAVAACSSSSSSSSAPTDTTPVTPSTAAAPGPAAAVSGSSAIATIPAADRSPAGSFGTKPTVTVPSGSPPKALEAADLIVGTGPAAKDGDQLDMQYVGVSYTLRRQFDASWDRGQPFTFPLGGGQVIPGWDQGLVGMKVGGRRELIIPPGLAYGTQSPSPDIPPNDTLVFVVDLVKIG